MAQVSGTEREARRLYRFLFKEELPSNWHVAIRVQGSTYFGGDGPEIIACASDFESAIPTLIHEFLHQRHPKWKHGKKFETKYRQLVRKVIRYE